MFSPKGGVGTTTIAVNLALLAGERNPRRHAADRPRPVVRAGVVAPQPGAQADAAGARPRRRRAARAGAVPAPTRSTTRAASRSSPRRWRRGSRRSSTPRRVELVLERALEAFDIVIVDAGTTFDDRMLAISSRSDTVVMPVLPEIPALNAVHLLMDQLTETGALGATTVFVLNNAFAARPAQAVGHRERAGRADQRGPAVRLDRLPQGGERGQPGRPQRAEVDGRRRPAQPRQHRPRPGRRPTAATDGKGPAPSKPAKERRGLFGRRR